MRCWRRSAFGVVSFSVVKGVLVLIIAAVALVLGLVFAFRGSAYHEEVPPTSISTTAPA